MEQRNLLVAIALSIAILLGFQYVYGPAAPPPDTSPATQVGAPPAPDGGLPVPPAEPGAPASPIGAVAADRGTALAEAPRLVIDSPRVHGSISLRGGRLDDVTLPDYRTTVNPNSPEIVVLSPPGSVGAWYGEFGWVGAGGVIVPDADTLWETDATSVVPNKPVTLTWDNGQGLIFSRTFTLDDDFLFTVTQAVENTGEAAATLYPYGLVSRAGTPSTSGFFILHEGPIGVIDGVLREYSYGTLRDDGRIQAPATGGWLGFTDKYWLVALIPDQAAPLTTRFSHSFSDGSDKYQADYLRAAVTVPPGGRQQVTDRLFAGAKEVTLIDRYEEQLGVARFDRAVDWGWFYFLTRPIFYALHWLNGVLGNYGLAILALTLAIKIVFFPLANKSYRAMSQMKKLQPEMLRLRERYGDDKAKMNQELMALYRKEKINPAAGCLPILVQIPVFFALYKVLFVTIELRHAPFYGWIEDLSAPDPTNLFNLFGLIPWAPPDFLHLGIWPII
ncbi:MAG: membrane protein insertase YidC, partial [Alphaproteobacteria bacterium]